MNDFPEFMKNRLIKWCRFALTKVSRVTFSTADGSQMVILDRCGGGKSIEHTHAYDDMWWWCQGQYTVYRRESNSSYGRKEFFI